MGELFDLLEHEHLPSLAPNTRTSYGDSLKPLRAFFVVDLGDPLLERIQPGHIRQYLTWRRFRGPTGEPVKKPLSNRTLQRDRAVLHKAFSLAVAMEYSDRNPVSAVQAPRPEARDPVILTDDELERLLSECEDRPMLWLYVLTMAETGARSESEVLWIQWEDIDLDGGFVWIDSNRDGHRTKSGKGRWVPLTSHLQHALRNHAADFRFATYGDRRSPWVFHHRTTARTAVAGARIRTMRNSVKSAARRAELSPRFTQHDLRHRRVTKWLAEEKNPVHVKEAVGHASLATTMAYTHLAREHLRSLVAEPQTRSLPALAR
jgi:integrase/recombinase XerD